MTSLTCRCFVKIFGLVTEVLNVGEDDDKPTGMVGRGLKDGIIVPGAILRVTSSTSSSIIIFGFGGIPRETPLPLLLVSSLLLFMIDNAIGIL